LDLLHKASKRDRESGGRERGKGKGEGEEQERAVARERVIWWFFSIKVCISEEGISGS